MPDIPAPIACSLNAADLGERAARWRRLGSQAGASVDRAVDGLALSFRHGPGVAAELADLARLERECCPFAEWVVADRDGVLTLAVTAHDAIAV
ncbi:MAG: heavy metal-responsive transcriptional regulator, partial [Jatrophihabitantaceae bacterium]